MGKKKNRGSKKTEQVASSPSSTTRTSPSEGEAGPVIRIVDQVESASLDDEFYDAGEVSEHCKHIASVKIDVKTETDDLVEEHIEEMIENGIGGGIKGEAVADEAARSGTRIDDEKTNTKEDDPCITEAQGDTDTAHNDECCDEIVSAGEEQEHEQDLPAAIVATAAAEDEFDDFVEASPSKTVPSTTRPSSHLPIEEVGPASFEASVRLIADRHGAEIEATVLGEEVPLLPACNLNDIRSKARPRMMTLDDLKKRSEAEATDDNDQTFFAGGEKSAMAVQGGAAPKRNNDLVDEIMEQARSQQASGSGGGLRAFTGRSNRLTDPDTNEERVIEQPRSPSASSSDEEEVAVRTITFWSDGFTLEPVPTLRPFTDPPSISLLSSIRSGLAPLHELGVQPGQAVEMRVVQRDREAFSKEGQERVWKEVREAEQRKGGRGKVRAFSGAGRRLGDLPTSPSNPGHHDTVQPQCSTRLSGGFDADKPATKLQFRLADGSKHTLQFNSDQTVADIYATLSEILGGGQVGVLLSGRPPVALPAKEMTLKEAGLEGSLIIQQQP